MNEIYEYEGLRARCISKDLVEIKIRLDDKNPTITRKPSSMSLETFVKKYAKFIKTEKPKFYLKGIL